MAVENDFLGFILVDLRAYLMFFSNLRCGSLTILMEVEKFSNNYKDIVLLQIEFFFTEKEETSCLVVVSASIFHDLF